MKKLRLLFCLLVVVCIVASSSTTFSAIPQGKFPIEIFSSRDTPNQHERVLIKRLEQSFNNSPKFRVTNSNEDRIMLTILINEYIPGVVSTDVFASSTPINTFSLVWLVKPKNKHAYFIWHNSGRFQTYDHLNNYILDEANIIASKIRNYYSHLFD